MAHATTPLSAGLARVTADRVSAWRRAVPAARRGHTRGIHRLRTASRRLREALRLAAEAAPDAGAERLARDVRRVARLCAPLRDADVRLETFRREVQHGDFHPAAIASVQRALAADRDIALEALPTALGTLDLSRWTSRARQLHDALDHAAGSPALDRALARQLRRRVVDLRRCLDEAGTIYSPERLHRARIAIKKLRYVQELATALGAGSPNVTPILKRAQRLLGRMHDLHVLEQRVRAIVPGPAETVVSAALMTIADAIDREGRAAHGHFLRQAGPVGHAARQAARALALEVAARRPMIKSRLKSRASARARRAHGA